MPYIDKMSFNREKMRARMETFCPRAISGCTLVLMVLLLETLLTAWPARGTVYYVDVTNGNNSWSGTSSNYLGGTTGPLLNFAPFRWGAYPSIALNPGDVVYALAGVLDHSNDNVETSLTPAYSGTSNAPIVFSNYPGGYFTIANSGSNCNTIGLAGLSWVKFFGINSTNAYRQVAIQRCTNCEIAYCNFGGGNTNFGCGQPFIMYNNSQSNWIHDNTVHDALAAPVGDSTHCLTIGLFYSTNDWTSYNILEGNTCYHAGHDTLSCYGPSNVLINNFIHNENWFYRYDLQHMAAHRCMEVGGYLGFANVIEGNRAQYAGYCYNTPHGLEVDGPGTCIIRNNVLSDNGYSGITVYGCKVAQTKYYWGRNYIYNNTIAKNGFGTNSINIYTNATLSSVVNATPWLPAVTIANSTNNVFVNNLLWDNFVNVVTGENVPLNIGAALALNNIYATSAKMFVDTTDGGPWSQTQPNYALQTGSPAIDAGTWLTTVTSASGTGTSFTVADPNYFFAGMTAASRALPGDTIQLQGQTVTATITAISGHTITVATPLSWSAGQGLALAYAGIAPDAGAYEYYPLAAPTNLRIVGAGP
jgi:hypothetical protein